MNNYPIFKEIPYQDANSVYALFADQAWSIFLDSADSAQQMEDTNRYSYIGVDPFEKIVIKNKKLLSNGDAVEQPFQYLKQVMNKYKLDHKPGYPLFQGGALGFFSYDLCHYLEEVNYPKHADENPYPDLAIGLYDIIIAVDHVEKKSELVSTGFPEIEPEKRLARAQKRINEYLQKLLNKASNEKALTSPGKVELRSPFDKKTYANIVKKAQNYILEGDIFEVNLSHRFTAKIDAARTDKYQLYCRMREHNPSPFSAYLNFDEYQILSASPERFILLNGDQVSTRPIKGTAPRHNDPLEDQRIAKALQNSEKDRSENIIIVDLMRNDLSKICLTESIEVKKLCGLESYPSVHHLVSVVQGQLTPESDAFDLLEASFPGGSITGAPKIRSMQIIYELEPTARGPYCGSVGFIGFDGSMDTSIIIRTLLSYGDHISYQAGGAVVMDSSPEGEYIETLTKSAAIQSTLASWNKK